MTSWVRIGVPAMSRVLLMAGLRAVTSGPAAASGAPGFELGTGARLDQERQASGTVSRWSTLLQPAMSLSRGGGAFGVALRAGADLASHDAMSTLEALHVGADGSLTRVIGRSDSLAAWGGATVVRDPLVTSGATSVWAGDVTTRRASAAYGAWRAAAAGSLHDWHYATPTNADALQRSIGVVLKPMRTPITTGCVEARVEETRLDHAAALRVGSLTAGFDRRHQPWLSSSWRFGAAEVEQAGATDPTARLAWLAAMRVGEDGYGGGLSGHVVARQERILDLDAEVSLVSNAARVAARWTRGLHAEGGIYHDVMSDQQALLTVEPRLGAGASGTLEFSWTRVLPLDGGAVAGDVRRGSVGFRAAFGSRLEARARYEVVSQWQAGGGSRSTLTRAVFALAAGGAR